MTKVIALYNNKGGVSKTTTTFSLAVLLSQQGKQVLVVDCDPQCNMTELFLAMSEDLDDPSKELPGTSIYEAFLPRFRGQQSEVNQADVGLVRHERYDRLYLFKGDLAFSQAETYFGTAWNQAVTENIHEKNTYVALHRLFESLGSARGFDYILCDVGPSTGAITRTVVLSCDEIVIPLVPDRFCYQAVQLLGTVVKQWISQHKVICSSLTPFGIEPFPGRPMLAGTILQNFKVHQGSRVKASYLKWQERIAQEISNCLVGEDGLEAKSSFNPDAPYTASIKDVAVLAPVAQLFGRAIFDIEQEHTKEASSDGRMYYGTVWEPWLKRMEEYKAEIEKIAEALK